MKTITGKTVVLTGAPVELAHLFVGSTAPIMKSKEISRGRGRKTDTQFETE